MLKKHQVEINNYKKSEKQPFYKMKNMLKFKISEDTQINLETKVANQALIRYDSQGSVKDIKNIDFEFEAENLADFYNSKASKKA